MILKVSNILWDTSQYSLNTSQYIPAQEVKNSLFDRYCATLCTSSAFDNISHEHLTVGHTHEDVGDFAASRLIVPTMSLTELNSLVSARFGKSLDFAEMLYLD